MHKRVVRATLFGGTATGSVCGIQRNGLGSTNLTWNNDDVTCKRCRRSLGLGEHDSLKSMKALIDMERHSDMPIVT